MLRISEVAVSPSGVTLKVEGRVVSTWVGLLEQEILRHLRERREVRLDFSGVTFIDQRGVHMLRWIESKQLHLINCSGLVADLVQTGRGQ